jgi:hypothetical protein
MRLASPALFLLLAPACTDLGDRAVKGCPPGETCSSETPDGLEFSGPYFGDAGFFADPGVKTTAVGGTQTIELIDHASGQTLDARFEATTTTAALNVVETGAGTVTLTGSTPGSGQLEIRSFSGLLHDRLWVDADGVSSVTLVPAWTQWRDTEASWEVWAGATAPLVVAIHGSTGARLVDESMEILGTGVTRDAWDSVRIPVPAEGASLFVDTGDVGTIDLTVAATSQIDDFVVSQLLEGQPRVGDTQSWCFRARHQGADVLFVPWTFTVEGPAHEEGLALFENCVNLALDAVGLVTVTAQAPGHEPFTASFEVFEAEGRAARRAPIAPEAMPLELGERASVAD